jgi:hypothetical protein
MSEPLPPHEWLLGRHRQATARLDALRRSALPTPAMTWRQFLAELFRPHRPVWRVLALVWLILAVVHLSHRPAKPPASVPSTEAFAAWLQQLKSHETLAQVARRR